MELEKTKQGILIRIHVTPNTKGFAITGYDSWRKALKLKTKSKALEGKANKEIEKQLEKTFKTRVKIVSGEKSREKKLLLQGTSQKQAREILGKIL